MSTALAWVGFSWWRKCALCPCSQPLIWHVMFPSLQMEAAKFQNNPATGSILSAQINTEKNFCFLEFRTVEECTRALAFDGIQVKGQGVKLRRPKDYQPMPGAEVEAPTPQPYIPGVISTQVPDTVNKIYIGNLPNELDAEVVKELLTQFGALKAFHLVTDTNTGVSKGFAFCEFADPSVTEKICSNEGLNNFPIGDKFLTVQRASIGASKGGPPPMMMGGMPGMMMPPGMMPPGMMPPGMMPPSGMPPGMMPPAPVLNTHNVAATKVLVLMNMLTVDELKDDDEYEEIVEDIRDECVKYGAITSLEVPRPREGEEGQW